MALRYHPKQGTIVRVAFDAAFKLPEMVKPRLCVVVSKPIEARAGLCTIVPLSTTAPDPIMPYHCKVAAPFALPKAWGQKVRWLKGDMIYSVGFHRVDLLRLGKDRSGKRLYQTQTHPVLMMREIQACILCGLGLEKLTDHL